MILQVYSLEDGPVHDVWGNLGVPVSIVQTCDEADVIIDWLKYACDAYFIICHELITLVCEFKQC